MNIMAKKSTKSKGSKEMIVIAQANGDVKGKEISVTILMYTTGFPAMYNVIYSINGSVITERDMTRQPMTRFYLEKLSEFPTLRWHWTEGFLPPEDWCA
jgi:hypothetical protein